MSTHVLSSTYSTPSSYNSSRASYPNSLIGRTSSTYSDSAASSYYTRLSEKSAPSGTIHLHSSSAARGAGQGRYNLSPSPPVYQHPRPQSQYVETRRWVEPDYEMRGATMPGRYPFAEKRSWTVPEQEVRRVKEYTNLPPPPTSAPKPRVDGQVAGGNERPTSFAETKRFVIPVPPPAAAPAVGSKSNVYEERRARGDRVRLRDVAGGILGRVGDNIERFGHRVGGQRTHTRGWSDGSQSRRR